MTEFLPDIVDNDLWKQSSFMLPTILLIHTGDKRSRDFIESLSGDEYASFHSIIDWYNPNDYDKMYEYLEDCHYPSPTDFPCAIVFLPATHTYAKDGEDKIARLTAKPGEKLTYKMIVQDGLWSMLEVIIEDRMMSESYKVMKIKEKMLMNATIPDEVLHKFLVCNTVRELQLMHQRLAVKIEETLLEEIKSETTVDLGVKIELYTPPEPIPAPNWYRERKPLQLLTVPEGN